MSSGVPKGWRVAGPRGRCGGRVGGLVKVRAIEDQGSRRRRVGRGHDLSQGRGEGGRGSVFGRAAVEGGAGVVKCVWWIRRCGRGGWAAEAAVSLDWGSARLQGGEG